MTTNMAEDLPVSEPIELPTPLPVRAATAPEGATPPRFSVSRVLSTLAEPGGARAESIGALRTHILAQHIRDGRRTLAMCAPSAGVGCSFITANLAVAMAQAGIKTLLIDGNLREPSLEGFIQPDRPVAGLYQCLTDAEMPLSEVIQSEVMPGLSLMYAGGSAGNAQELLASNAFKALIDSCARDFDLTLIDTPPANESADARRIATVFRYALVVVGRNNSFVADVKTLVEELQADRAKVIGTFLNDI